MQIQPLSPKSKAVIQHMIAKLENNYLKINNDSSFMSVIVEDIGEIKGYGKLYSVAHYGKLNGDPMRDPDMTFVEKDGEYYPVSFRNDYVAVDHHAFKFDDEGNVTAINSKLQSEFVAFANLWMRNIKSQQELEL